MKQAVVEDSTVHLSFASRCLVASLISCSMKRDVISLLTKAERFGLGDVILKQSHFYPLGLASLFRFVVVPIGIGGNILSIQPHCVCVCVCFTSLCEG